MKKSSILLVASVMCVSALFGCNKKKDDGSSTSPGTTSQQTSNTSANTSAAGTSSQAGGTSRSSSQASSRASSSTDSTIHVQSVTVSPANTTIYLEEDQNTLQLTANVLPENATNKAVVWASNNASVSVDETGLVTALDVTASRATITATSVDGNKVGVAFVTVKRSRSEETTINSLTEPAFLTQYKTNTSSLDPINTIQTTSNPNRESYYQNEDGTRDTYK